MAGAESIGGQEQELACVRAQSCRFPEWVHFA
jgi:hypothetical protein